MMSCPSKLREDFNLCFKEQVLKFLEERHQPWEQAAGGEGRRWLGWHWSQYKAFCLNDGHHETPKRPREDWNAKILWKMRMELAYQWDLVEEEVLEAFERLGETITARLEDLKSVIEDLAGSSTVSFWRSLTEGIDCWIKDLEYKLGRHKENLSTEVKAIRRCASESNYNSYVLGEMLPAYRSAGSQSGSNMSARQKDIVQGRITDGTLFPNISVSISTAMAELVDKTERQLHAGTSAVLSHIENDFELAFQKQGESLEEEEGEQGGEDADADERVSGFVEEVELLRQEHARLLETIPSV